MTKKVLVVEDDELSQFVLVEMCRELGFHCMTADGGKQAIKVVAENADKIGIVLMDIHMPGFSGLDATRAIRSNPADPPKNIPVVATTADVHWRNPERCRKYGFNSTLLKPVTLAQLSEALHRHTV